MCSARGRNRLHRWLIGYHRLLGGVFSRVKRQLKVGKVEILQCYCLNFCNLDSLGKDQKGMS